MFEFDLYVHRKHLYRHKRTLKNWCPEKKNKLKSVQNTLVTQPMSQLRTNWSELRSMDYYHQIFVDSKNVSEKFLHRPPSVMILKKVVFFSKFLVMIFFQNWHFWTLDGIFEIKMMMKICLGVIRFGIGVLRKKLG